jgi:hypothetical protein
LTGSTGGLGFAIAEGLAMAGCRIMLNGLETPATVERRRAELEKRSGVSIGYREADVGELSGVEDLIEACLERFGSVDILVNNGRPPFSPIVDFPSSTGTLPGGQRLGCVSCHQAGSASYAHGQLWPYFHMTSVPWYARHGESRGLCDDQGCLARPAACRRAWNPEYDVTRHSICPDLSPPQDEARPSNYDEQGLPRDGGRLLQESSPSGDFVLPRA